MSPETIRESNQHSLYLMSRAEARLERIKDTCIIQENMELFSGHSLNSLPYTGMVGS